MKRPDIPESAIVLAYRSVAPNDINSKFNMLISLENNKKQAEILAKCVKSSNSFYEVPVNYSGRSAFEGKKIKFYHIFSVIKEIIKNRII